MNLLGGTTWLNGRMHYVPDILPGFDAATLPLAPDAEDPAGSAATLVRTLVPGATKAVLYLHGFSDYFFQAQHASEWTNRGYQFYALDLRRYGRSLRPGQTPNYVTDLSDYMEELDAAYDAIRADGMRTIIGLGHSTGGLILPLWAHSRKASRPLDALILNSPWFEINKPAWQVALTWPVVQVAAAIAPKTVVAKLGDAYGSMLHTSTGGGWDYSLDLKPLNGFPVHAAWLRAIRRGQKRLHAGLSVGCPVLLCTSDQSGPDVKGHHLLDRSDTVLNVKHMWKFAPMLGAPVTVVKIPGGVHDLALGSDAVRTAYVNAIFSWLEGV